jgi:hypothetical protein
MNRPFHKPKNPNENKIAKQYRVKKTKPRKRQFNEVVRESAKLFFLLSQRLFFKATPANGGTNTNKNSQT